MSNTDYRLSLEEVLQASQTVVPPGCTLYVSSDSSGQPESFTVKDGEGNDVVVGWRSIRRGVVHHREIDVNGRLKNIYADLAGWQVYRTEYYPRV